MNIMDATTSTHFGYQIISKRTPLQITLIFINTDRQHAYHCYISWVDEGDDNNLYAYFMKI